MLELFGMVPTVLSQRGNVLLCFLILLEPSVVISYVTCFGQWSGVAYVIPMAWRRHPEVTYTAIKPHNMGVNWTGYPVLE